MLPRSRNLRQYSSSVKQQWCLLTDSPFGRRWQSCSRPIRNFRSISSGISFPSCRPPTALSSAHNIPTTPPQDDQSKVFQFPTLHMTQSCTEVRLLAGRKHESKRLKIKAPPVERFANPASHERKSQNKTAEKSWKNCGGERMMPTNARYLANTRKSTKLEFCRCIAFSEKEWAPSSRCPWRSHRLLGHELFDAGFFAVREWRDSGSPLESGCNGSGHQL